MNRSNPLATPAVLSAVGTVATLAALVAFTLLWPLPLKAHEGHDHGEPPAAELLPVLAPRAEAAGDAVELLAVIDARQLTLYLDRFDTNEPINGARIEVESGSFKGVASPLGDGVYRLPAAALQKPGEHPLVFTVQFGDQADLLETTLKVSASGNDAAATPRASTGSAGGWRAALPVAGGVLAGGAALWVLATVGQRLRRQRVETGNPLPGSSGSAA